MIIHQTCRHFKSDLPCVFNKREGVHCEECSHFDEIEYKILIVKLDAMGDVLRTTCILPGLREKFPKAHISWLTRKDSVPLFLNNPYVDTILDYSPETFLYLQTEGYDMVLGLDASPESTRIVTLAFGKEKLGFGYNLRGFSYPLNEEARDWYEMGLFDDVKKKNHKTYQDIVLEICRLKPNNHDIIFTLSAEEEQQAQRLNKKWKLHKLMPVIGVNPGAGKRWVNKKWPEKNAIEFIRLLLKEKFQVILLGGKEEEKINTRIAAKVRGKLINSGCKHTVREYASIMSLCDLVVTMDTLSLHLALALKKKVAALFGPTSADEIDVYNNGIKLMPEEECQCYYQKSCLVKRHCMETITPENVLKAVEQLLSGRRV